MSNSKKIPIPKPPTWKSINSKKCVKSAQQRKVNDELRKYLQTLGWSMWDSCNILEHGYTITLRKIRPELQINRNPYLFFSWYWDSQGGPDFWIASLHGFYDYEPEYQYMKPSGLFEINDIISRNKLQIPRMEERVTSAILTQTRLTDS